MEATSGGGGGGCASGGGGNGSSGEARRGANKAANHTAARRWAHRKSRDASAQSLRQGGKLLLQQTAGVLGGAPPGAISTCHAPSTLRALALGWPCSTSAGEPAEVYCRCTARLAAG